VVPVSTFAKGLPSGIFAAPQGSVDLTLLVAEQGVNLPLELVSPATFLRMAPAEGQTNIPAPDPHLAIAVLPLDHAVRRPHIAELATNCLLMSLRLMAHVALVRQVTFV
jgi:hypothetical protein